MIRITEETTHPGEVIRGEELAKRKPHTLVVKATGEEDMARLKKLLEDNGIKNEEVKLDTGDLLNYMLD